MKWAAVLLLALPALAYAQTEDLDPRIRVVEYRQNDLVAVRVPELTGVLLAFPAGDPIRRVELEVGNAFEATVAANADALSLTSQFPVGSGSGSTLGPASDCALDA